MVQAVMEAWIWLVPAFAVGMMSGWVVRRSIDEAKEHELEAEVARDVGRIEELQRLVELDERRIHQMEDELAERREARQSRARAGAR